MQDKEWEEASRRAERPMAVHFAVVPHTPASGVLLNENGEPVLTNYSTVDWKALAVAARSTIDRYAPKDMKIFVANDAVDVMDLLDVSTEDGQALSGNGYMAGVQSALSMLKMKDLRAGIINLSGNPVNIHRNPPIIDGKRTPLGMLIMSVKVSRASQILDYFTGTTRALFGCSARVASYKGFSAELTTGDMPPYLTSWLRSQFGVVYGTQCTVFATGLTFAD